jgi:hypothetical protein
MNRSDGEDVQILHYRRHWLAPEERAETREFAVDSWRRVYCRDHPSELRRHR